MKQTAEHLNPAGRPGAKSGWLLVTIIGVTSGLVTWLVWPSPPELDPHELSGADGKPRFFKTTYPINHSLVNTNLYQILVSRWADYRSRRLNTPASCTFLPTPVRPCSIHGLLNQCMEVSGTQYLIAVEVSGAVYFGYTNVLTGAQFVRAFEEAISTNRVTCYDYLKHQNFEDNLVLIRENSRLVKVLPASKVNDYEKAGLIRRKP